MSSQWEVVGRKKGKDNGTLNKKSASINGKKIANVPLTPKIEDVLPLSKVKSLYKENRKPTQEKVLNNNNKQHGSKPNAIQNGNKKQQHDGKQNEAVVTKPKASKTIESALKAIDPVEFQSCLDTNKALFPDAPIIWMKYMVQFLNQKVSVDVQDHTFSNRPDMYPLSVVPSDILAIIEKSVKDAGENNAQLFFDISLTTMATDMSKNLSTFGHKFYLQYLATNFPHYVAANSNKYVALRTSYQNRQNIGLSILWALNQAGLKDLQAGLKVFQELLLPLVEMKSYSRYVVRSLIDLIRRHERSASLNVEQYLLVLDVTYATYKNFPNDLRSELDNVKTVLDDMLLANLSKDDYHNLVEPLLKKVQSSASGKYKTQICGVLVLCLKQDKNALTAWSRCYTKNVQQSATLLQYIDHNWALLSGSLNNSAFSDLLRSYDETNEELKSKRKREIGVELSAASIQSLTLKMATRKSSRSPLRRFLLLLIIAAGGLFYYDVRQNGSYAKSQTARFIKEHPAIRDGLDTSLKTLNQGLAWAHQQADKLVPGYYETTHKYLQPYGKLASDLGLVIVNAADNVKELAVAKYPVVREWIETYAPGLIDHSKKAVNDAWSASLIYYHRSVDYLKTEVFVGQLAPENVQKVVWEALNTTQQKATECYHWLYEKVQSSIK